MNAVTPVNSMGDHGDGRPADWISTEEIQGCWDCCCALPIFSAIERRRAEGADVLWHEGCCFPLCDAWDRDSDSNTFVKRGKWDGLHYPSAGGPLRPFVRSRLGRLHWPAAFKLCKCRHRDSSSLPTMSSPRWSLRMNRWSLRLNQLRRVRSSTSLFYTGRPCVEIR